MGRSWTGNNRPAVSAEGEGGAGVRLVTPSLQHTGAMLWSPGSWRTKKATQQPEYECEGQVTQVLEQISSLPPLVTSWELIALQQQLYEGARGQRFLLQGGDCAESFNRCDAETIASKVKILLQMSIVLVHGGRKPVIRVGRFAGQYAKPRSNAVEQRDQATLPSYRGDLINGPEFSRETRRPDPSRMLRGYERSAMTLNFIRALVSCGFADPHHLEYWDLNRVKDSPMAEEYRRMARDIDDALLAVENMGGSHPGEVLGMEFFTSHEGLHLAYEQAQTRRVPYQDGWYNLGTHFPWIGLRTCAWDGAHVEYFRGIGNPIGVKVGPSTTPASLRRLIEILDPEDKPGRLTLIHRFGNEHIAGFLPPLIRAVQRTGRTVLWCCDPMHGNDRRIANGVKTRYFDDILGELDQAFDIHAENGSRLGGIHIELTGEDVTECMGGARQVTEADLARLYESDIDPRLNYEQALETAMFVARKMRSIECCGAPGH